jgi:putative membrane protein
MRMSDRFDQAGEGRIWKGMIAGAAGGLAGAWTMNLLQAGLAKMAEASSNGQKQKEQESDDATVKAASAISETVADHKLTAREKKLSGPAVHYAFGAVMGALYGGAAEVAPASARGWGLPFGTVLWAGADEVGVPMAGLSGPPWETPASTHASALAAHLVYGATVEGVRRAVRFAL